MLSRDLLGDLARAGIEIAGEAPRSVGGGSISRVLRLQSGRGPVLLKLGSLERGEMFEAEVESLDALRAARAAAVPEVLACGSAGEHAYLALEWIDFAAKTPEAERALGGALAQQHRCTAPRFGWHRDNYIGATPQRNAWSDEWLVFFRDERLGYQLELAASNGLTKRCQRLCTSLMTGIDALFQDYDPAPSLLHGDLWGGNWGADPDGVPYLYDPAVYYGDRETDLAMTRLFGGFGESFYRAYRQAWPLAAGWESRVELYNLYHLLNHFNLFGDAYLPRVEVTLEALRKVGG